MSNLNQIVFQFYDKDRNSRNRMILTVTNKTPRFYLILLYNYVVTNMGLSEGKINLEIASISEKLQEVSANQKLES